MPTFDGGHGFLTALLPISTKSFEEKGIWSSPVHLVRERLSAMPTANQSPFTARGVESPFARNGKTHFLRMAVIDDLVFNGRVSKDTILGGQDPMVPQPVDSLNCAYLMFCADFDAPRGQQAELDAYLRELWGQVKVELEPILICCHGFRKGTDEAGFVSFIRDRMIDTTMPFNDYWPDKPALKDPDQIPLFAGSLALLLVLFFVVFWLTHLLGWRSGLIWHSIFSLLVGAVLVAAAAVWAIGKRAAKPFPMAPGSDLPGVLKSLYLQRAFGAFAVEVQRAARAGGGGAAAADAGLYEAFGRFLSEHKPSLPEGPTQKAGTILGVER